ncbi:MAG TPA: tripartite tricarboxylate transporter substrate binding protein [Burkholderiales bacterium]|nr:tripartite tricarboxylate transporter substrate binding protein [Burkholderiales bacterium]
MHRRIARTTALTTLAAALAVSSGAASGADPYPVKPVRLIVPYAAGGTGDIIGRMVGGKLAEVVGQTVIVENRPGAGGNIGAEATVRAAPDGYTVVIAATSLASNPSLQRKMPFDPLKDLAAVGGCCEVATILVVHPSLPAKSVKEFIALAKANPAKLSYASSGFGTTSHLAAELFKVLARVDMVHVPYKADSVAMPDVLGGRVPVMFMLQTTAAPQIKAGKLRPLGVSTATRSPAAPDLPTVAEAGLAGYEISAWFGLFVPAATSRDIVERLGAALVKAVRSPDMKERLLEQGFVPIGSPPDQFAAFFRGEVQKWARVVKEGKLALID